MKNQNPLRIDIMRESQFNSFYGENSDFVNQNDVNANGMVDLYAGAQPANVDYAGNSDPYIIILTNTSGAAINNVVFLNAVTSIWDNSTYGVTAGVTPTVGYSGNTYQAFLAMLMQMDLTAGSFYIEATTNAQATATISFETNNQKGTVVTETLIPKIHYMQNMTGLAYVEKEVLITKFTKATLSSIAASAVYKLNIYPSKRTTVYGNQVVYKRPNFITTGAWTKQLDK